MSVTYYRKFLGVGPYETREEYLADLDPDGDWLNFGNAQVAAGNIESFEYKLAVAKNAMYGSCTLANDAAWNVVLAAEASAGFNFKNQFNVITVTQAEYEAGA